MNIREGALCGWGPGDSKGECGQFERNWGVNCVEWGKVERFGDGRVAGAGGSVAPAVATTTGGGGGVESGGKIQDGDLSLGFGYAPREPVPPGSHAGLWGRPTAAATTYSNFHHHRPTSTSDAGHVAATLGVGLAGTQHEIFRDILSRREDFAYVQQQQQHHHHHQQQLQQQQHHHQHQLQQSLQRQVNIVGEGPNYGDAGRGEAESSSSGSVDKGAQHQQQQVEPWAARALREEVVARGMDVQALSESRQAAAGASTQQAVLNVEPVQQQQQQAGLPPPQQQQQVAGGSAAQVGSSTACQECGNQAKKDCSFQRCRTCCKSRDFDCATHVKSTWVPASKRRERQAAEAAAAAAGQPRLKSKRSRGLAAANTLAGAPTAGATTSMTTTSANSPRGSDINSGHPSHPGAQARAGLPPEVRAQALFKCVRVTGVEDGENEFAYQATVKIGGHIFKGVLYDQGLDLAQQQAVTSNPSDLQLGARGGSSALPASTPLLDPSGMYAPSNSLLGGEDPRWFS